VFSRLRDSSLDLPSLKTFVSGGSKLDGDSFLRIRNAFSIDLLHGYGLTEFTPISRNLRGCARPGTIGPLCAGLECRFSSRLADGSGEIQVRAPSVARGYYRRPQESAEAFQDGWFRTGDLGCLEGGHLIFLSELKNTRKINGNIVDLKEVSRALKLDSEVAEAEVAWEKGSLTARIVASAHVDIEAKSRQLKTFLRENLAEYKIPRRISQI
jgi:long-chain acyl-CoA synthetase